MAKRYFKNLDGLRFVAATAVSLSHLEMLKQYRNLPFVHNRFFENAPQIAVTFFFVLSGFLIMWWILEETGGDTAKISLRFFYITRIARTWPLYFLIVFVAIVISVFNGTFANDPLAVKRYAAYLLFLPNTADLFFKKDIYLSPTWSLAVEEVFYFFFPLLLLKVQKERLLHLLFILTLVFILLSTLTNRIFLIEFVPHLTTNEAAGIVTTFFERYRFYAFLSGAMAAAALFYNRLPRRFFSNNILYAATGFLLIVLFFSGITFSFLTQQAYAVFFAIFICFLAARNKPTLLLQNTFAVWGGKISYGIYMLHVFVILRLINQGIFFIQFNNTVLSIFTSWVLFLAITFAAAHFSYKLFENPIRMFARSRFAVKEPRTGT
jgi:peptidoglycan/LPS O-acetylase OafA/YrhL